MIPTWLAAIGMISCFAIGVAAACVLIARWVVKLVEQKIGLMAQPVNLEPPMNLGQECARVRAETMVDAFQVVDRLRPREHGALCGCLICEAHRELRGKIGEFRGTNR